MLDGLDLQKAVNQPRIHHQYLPDEVQYEAGAFSEDEQAELVRRGHELRIIERGYGNMHAVSLDRSTGMMGAASDKRGEGGAALLVGGKVKTKETFP